VQHPLPKINSVKNKKRGRPLSLKRNALDLLWGGGGHVMERMRGGDGSVSFARRGEKGGGNGATKEWNSVNATKNLGETGEGLTGIRG